MLHTSIYPCFYLNTLEETLRWKHPTNSIEWQRHAVVAACMQYVSPNTVAVTVHSQFMRTYTVSRTHRNRSSTAAGYSWFLIWAWMGIHSTTYFPFLSFFLSFLWTGDIVALTNRQEDILVHTMYKRQTNVRRISTSTQLERIAPCRQHNMQERIVYQYTSSCSLYNIFTVIPIPPKGSTTQRSLSQAGVFFSFLAPPYACVHVP